MELKFCNGESHLCIFISLTTMSYLQIFRSGTHITPHLAAVLVVAVFLLEGPT